MIRCQHRRLFVVEAVEANHWLDATNALHEGLTEFQHLLYLSLVKYRVLLRLHTICFYLCITCYSNKINTHVFNSEPIQQILMQKKPEKFYHC